MAAMVTVEVPTGEHVDAAVRRVHEVFREALVGWLATQAGVLAAAVAVLPDGIAPAPAARRLTAALLRSARSRPVRLGGLTEVEEVELLAEVLQAHYRGWAKHGAGDAHRAAAETVLATLAAVRPAAEPTEPRCVSRYDTGQAVVRCQLHTGHVGLVDDHLLTTGSARRRRVWMCWRDCDAGALAAGPPAPPPTPETDTQTKS
ncbi:hypothetical protein AB0I55_29310 [Actinocatenispora sera]|uniref:hypothetical protein n=1 Tax=Actinocatenispora sera TaxID=390989 RepID=UPI0033C60303